MNFYSQKEYRNCPPNLIDYATFNEFKYVSEAAILSKTDNFGIEGGDLELNCSFYGIVDGGFNITWHLPNDDMQKVKNIK